MITRGIRELMDRDWAAVRENKDAYWGERIGRLGVLEAFRIGEALRLQALAQVSDWPGAPQREADLASHIRVAALFRRASAARRG
jgi:hypothetical protein